MAELALCLYLRRDTAVHHGAVHGRRRRESETIAHGAAVLLRQISKRRDNDLHRALRRQQFQKPRERHLFPKGNCDAGPGSSGHCRISVSRLARIAATKKVHIKFQNLEMKVGGQIFVWLINAIEYHNSSGNLQAITPSEGKTQRSQVRGLQSHVRNGRTVVIACKV